MAPVKFGLFKARSRDHPEQPSTESLLRASTSSTSTSVVSTPCSPMPSTSRGVTGTLSPADLAALQLDSDDDDTSEHNSLTGRKLDAYEKYLQAAVEYERKNSRSTSEYSHATDKCSCSHPYEQLRYSSMAHQRDDDDATSIDVNSIQFDECSIAPYKELPEHPKTKKKNKKIVLTKKEQELRDYDMWTASNAVVFQNIESKSGSWDDRLKWEVVANSRGICTLSDTCSCDACLEVPYILNTDEDDPGMIAAPIFNAVSFGTLCQIQ